MPIVAEHRRILNCLPSPDQEQDWSVRAGNSKDAKMPIDCPNIGPVPVTISEAGKGGVQVAKVTPK